ncbi:glycosyltransferase [Winogradskyella echinorum]|uniref:Glycosyltransferase n=1 Tax=Winogradskyella echinorum TaxID=538189 RepID=A0ABR6XY29_9FLAO|nr:glycosyltransferase [Winogradskyella echinorum]MBC3845395.1 glycosyltransferase [Winogradskyella echinorum]MBC5749743.1 glycosyltransferase [Winogradskyella echinorum]
MILYSVITIIILYLFLIGVFTFGFDKVETFKLQDLPSKTKFSIVIPFRNEAENLPRLLTSISKLNYSKSMFEIILVDDDSEDDSIAIIEKVLDTKSLKKDFTRTDNIRIIKNKRTSNSPKKDAITTAIKASKFNWIITTDADCILPKYWLDAFDEYIQTTTTNCIVAPVTYYGRNSFLNRFQTLDFLSLQGATIGGFGIKKPFLSNGANFCYRKSLFLQINGFDGNDNISSGDDIFLLEKIIEHDSKKIHYLKSQKAVVKTNPASSVSNLIQQRLRWASKTSNLKNWFAKLVGLIVFLGNLVCIAFIPLVLFNAMLVKFAAALFIIKFSIDFLLLFKTSRFFKQETLLLSFLLSSFVYPFFNVGIAFLSFFKSYRWKGRTSKK